jgi:hypothetical protein
MVMEIIDLLEDTADEPVTGSVTTGRARDITSNSPVVITIARYWLQLY